MSKVTVQSHANRVIVVPFNRLENSAFFIWASAATPKSSKPGVYCKVGESDYAPIEGIHRRHTLSAYDLTRQCMEVDIDVTWTPTVKEEDQ